MSRVVAFWESVEVVQDDASALLAGRLESPSRKVELVLGCAAFGGCGYRMAILLGRVSEERITQSEVQRLERSRFNDRSANRIETSMMQ